MAFRTSLNILFVNLFCLADSPLQQKLLLAICHAVFVNGLTLKIDPSSGVEASEIYPEVKYTTMDEYLNHFV